MGMLKTFYTITAQQDMIYRGRRAARRDSPRRRHLLAA